MIETDFDSWENRLQEIAAEMDYPATPDIAAGVRRRLADEKRVAVGRPWYGSRLAWAVVAALLAVGLLLAVPQARAAIVNFFQIGDIRLFPEEPTVTPELEASSDVEIVPSPTAVVTAETAASSVSALMNLSGQSSFDELEAEFGEAALLPSYPEGIGLPDAVFFQDEFGLLGIQVWLDTADASEVWAVLYTLVLNEGAYGAKFHYRVDNTLLETEVDGQIAYWVEGEHMLLFYDAAGEVVPQLTRLVEGNTLLWTVGEVTYRLETALSLDEAVRMAESLR